MNDASVNEPELRLHPTQGTDFRSFSGHFARTIDDKARLTLPAGPWRMAFGSLAYVAAWRSGCIALWPEAQYQATLDAVAEQERSGLARPGAIELFRRNVHTVVIDSQGRLTLPPQVRERRAIPPGAEVIVEGQGDRLELRLAPVAPDDDEFDDLVDLLDHR